MTGPLSFSGPSAARGGTPGPRRANREPAAHDAAASNTRIGSAIGVGVCRTGLAGVAREANLCFEIHKSTEAPTGPHDRTGTEPIR